MDPTRTAELLDRIAALRAHASDEAQVAKQGTELAAEILGLKQAALVVGGMAQRPEILHNHGVSESYLRFLVEQYVRLPGARIMTTGRPFVVPDVRTHAAYAPILEHFERAGIRALVLFPQREPSAPSTSLAAGNSASAELFGVLAVYHPEPIEIDPVALSLANCLAEFVAVLLWGVRVRRDRDTFQRLALLERSNDAVAVTTAGVVHDFNNVLGAVLAMVSLWPNLREGERRAMQEELRTQVGQASRLTRSLLDTFRPARGAGGGDCETVKQTRSAIAMTSATAHPATAIEIVSDDAEHWARIDGGSFSRIVLNLLLNAVQAIGDRPSARVTVTIREDRDECVIEVDDNGPGIRAGQEERIFEPYVSSGKETGTGVGLAAARGLAERAGGSLALRHRSGPGACFVVRLPRGNPAPTVSADPTPVPPTSAPAIMGMNVLVAEDESLQRALFAQALRDAGFQVRECSSGAEAIEVLSREAFDAAVLDQRMPGSTGLEVLRHLRAAGKCLPVVMVSGFEVEQQDLSGPEFAHTKVVRKPLSGPALVHAVQSMLEGGSNG